MTQPRGESTAPAVTRPSGAPPGGTGRRVRVRPIERLTDLAIVAFLWAFRIIVVLIVVVGSILTLASGKYSPATWIDLIGTPATPWQGRLG